MLDVRRQLEPFVISEVEESTFKLISRSLVVLRPKELKDTPDLLVEHDPWGLCVIARTREDLIQKTKLELIELWKELVLTHNPLNEIEETLKSQLWKDFLMIIK